MTLDRIKTSTGRKLRGEPLQETVLPIPYDAAAMPGATVLGTDGLLYSSTKEDTDGDYKWYLNSRLTATGVLLLGANIEISSIVNLQPHSLRLQITDDANEASASFTRFTDTANPPRFHFQRGRGTLAAREEIGQADTTIGQVIWSGWDGSQWANAVRIQALNDAASAAQSMPGLLQVYTSPAGSRIPEERLRIDSSGNVLIGNTSGTEKLDVTGNIKASGALISSLLRVGSARDNFLVSPSNPVVYTPAIQVEGANNELSTLAITRSSNGNSDIPRLLLCRARGAAGNTIVQDGDSIANLMFLAHDGTWLRPASEISAFVEGTPVAGDSVPGSIRFRTAPAGGQLMVRMWITSDGNILIGNTTGTERLSVTGNIQLTNPADSFKVGTNNVLGSRKTGWDAPTGTATRTTFATYAGQDASATYVEAEVQAIDDHVKVLSERLKALIDDLTSHGLIGA